MPESVTSWDALPEEIRRLMRDWAWSECDAEERGPPLYGLRDAAREALATALLPYLRDAERMREIERGADEEPRIVGTSFKDWLNSQ